LSDSLADVQKTDSARSETFCVVDYASLFQPKAETGMPRRSYRLCVAKGYVADRVNDGIEAEPASSTTRYALMVVNMILLGKSGPSLLLWLRRVNSQVPVQTFSQDDCVAGGSNALNADADNQLSKPFDVRELVATCRALLRRSHGLR